MSCHKCSVCNDEFEEKYFDIEQDKCILHCDKNETNGWFKLNHENEKEWNAEKIRNFWGCIQKDLDLIYQDMIIESSFTPTSYLFNKVIFPKHEKDYEYNPHEHNIYDMGTNFYSFDVFTELNGEQNEEINTVIQRLYVIFNECTFLDVADFKKYKFEKRIKFKRCTFKKNVFFNKENISRILFLGCDFNNYPLLLNYSIFKKGIEISNAKNLNKLNLQNSIFEDDVQIKYSELKDMTNFTNTRFNGLADFNNTTFNHVRFRNTEFNQTSVFNEAQFNENVDFQYTKFVGNALFVDAIFMKKLNLRNTIFGTNPNFLGITSEKNTISEIDVENRETARIIKSSFDGIHNIIEANRFYALEMKKREEELIFNKNPLEWLVFKIHGLSSNHSQEWFTALLWIIVSGIMFYTWNQKDILEYNLKILFSIPFIVLIFKYTTRVFIKQSTLIYLIAIPFYCSKITFDSLAKALNPLGKFTNGMTFSELLFNIVIAYLIYQLVVSIRQNTRRK